MRVTRYLQVVAALVVVAITVPGAAHAQNSSGSNVWIGGAFGLSPLGHREVPVEILGMTIRNSEDTATALQFGGIAEYRPFEMLSIGVAPALILNVKDSDGTDSGSALDLPLRITLGGEVNPHVRLYGLGMLGYSIVFPPDSFQLDSRPTGTLFGFGGGAALHISQGLMGFVELGYHFRSLSGTNNGVDYTADLNYLTFNFGLVTRL